jgi:hypothetical protein
MPLADESRQRVEPLVVVPITNSETSNATEPR